MKSKFHDILITLVFTVFIASMLLAFILLPDKSFSDTEKRNLAQFPKAGTAAVLDGTFTEDVEDYIADQFPMRNFFTGVNAYYTLICGRNASMDIYKCESSYLINAPRETDGEVFRKNMRLFDKFAAKAGIPSRLVIVPRAGHIMEEKLPAGHREFDDDAYFEYAEKELKNIRFEDVSESLIAERRRGVFYKTDHHLTSYGNYVLCKSLFDMPGEGEYEKTSYDGFHGTTWSGSGYWLNGADTVELWDRGSDLKVTIKDSGKDEKTYDSVFFKEHLSENDMYPVFLDGNHALVKIENKNAKTDKKLLMVRDSYAHCMAPFLSEIYGSIYLVDMRYYPGAVSDLVEENGIDELMFVYGLDNLLTDSNAARLR